MNPGSNNAIQFHSDIAVEFARKYELSRAFKERFRVWKGLFDRYVKASDLVMDLGCGPGVFSRYLAEKGCLVTAIDGSQAMIDLCHEHHALGRATYEVQILPLPNPANYNHQHVIIASSVLEYIDDLPALQQQINGLLQPGGLFMVSMPNKQSIYRRVERLIFRITGRPRYVACMRNVSTETALNRQLTSLGFEVLETVYFAGYDPLSRLLKPILHPQFVNNLFVGVYRKRPSVHENH